MTRLVPALTLALLPLWAAGAAAAGTLTVTGAWIRATPPGAQTGAAYLTIENAGAADRLLDGSTAAARGVEIHTHVAEGGVQRMVRLPELTVPGGEAVRLEPGGLHLMLVDIAAPLTAGTRVTLSLRFAMAGTIVVEAPVVDARANPPPAHGTH